MLGACARDQRQSLIQRRDLLGAVDRVEHTARMGIERDAGQRQGLPTPQSDQPLENESMAQVHAVEAADRKRSGPQPWVGQPEVSMQRRFSPGPYRARRSGAAG